MEQKKVSVIIPVYNGESTLVQAIGNLVGQTLDQMELIFIDDHSTDRSLQILKDAKAQFPERVVVISSKENKGPGAARNLGLDQAKGAYIGFADCDDLVDPSMFEKMYGRAVQTGADLIDTGFYYEEKNNAILYTGDEDAGILSGEKRSNLIANGGYIWSKLIARKFFDDGLRFRESYALEDMEFLEYLFAKAEHIETVKEILYIYKNQPQSASKETMWNKNHNNIFSAMEAIYQKMSRLDSYEEMKEAVEYSMIQLYSFGINNLIKAKCQEEDMIAEALKQLREQRLSTIKEGYENQYVVQKMQQLDIEIMKRNDKDIKHILELRK